MATFVLAEVDLWPAEMRAAIEADAVAGIVIV
jgi:hypothetical protein